MNKVTNYVLGATLAMGLAFSLAGCASPGAVTSPPSATAAASSPATANTLAPLARVPSFELSSSTVAEGANFPLAQMSGVFGVPGGTDTSPELSWSGFPAETKSFVVTMFDPDAPSGSGFWHWVLADLPSTTTSLPVGGAGDELPPGARHLVNDAGVAGYIGAAPPAGTRHRYVITVSALSIPSVELPDDASPALLGFTIGGDTIARATITAYAEATG